jgi:hypothetical protein
LRKQHELFESLVAAKDEATRRKAEEEQAALVGQVAELSKQIQTQQALLEVQNDLKQLKKQVKKSGKREEPKKIPEGKVSVSVSPQRKRWDENKKSVTKYREVETPQDHKWNTTVATLSQLPMQVGQSLYPLHERTNFSRADMVLVAAAFQKKSSVLLSEKAAQVKTNSLEAADLKQKYEKARGELDALRQGTDQKVGHAERELAEARNALQDAQRELAKWQGPVASGIKASQQRLQRLADDQEAYRLKYERSLGKQIQRQREARGWIKGIKRIVDRRRQQRVAIIENQPGSRPAMRDEDYLAELERVCEHGAELYGGPNAAAEELGLTRHLATIEVELDQADSFIISGGRSSQNLQQKFVAELTHLRNLLPEKKDDPSFQVNLSHIPQYDRLRETERSLAHSEVVELDLLGVDQAKYRSGKGHRTNQATMLSSHLNAAPLEKEVTHQKLK